MGSIYNPSRKLIDSCPHPTIGTWWKILPVGGGGFFVFAAAVPVLATVSKDASEELFAGFVGTTFGLGEFGFGGSEAAFAGGLEDGGAIAFEVGLHATQRGHASVEAGELLFDFGDRRSLRCKIEPRQLETTDLIEVHAGTITGIQAVCESDEICCIEPVS